MTSFDQKKKEKIISSDAVAMSTIFFELHNHKTQGHRLEETTHKCVKFSERPNLEHIQRRKPAKKHCVVIKCFIMNTCCKRPKFGNPKAI